METSGDHVYRGSRAIRRAIFELRLSFLANYIHTKLKFLLKLLLKGTKNEAQFLNVAISYCPRPPVSRQIEFTPDADGGRLTDNYDCY
jgi:hypothetical protein